MGLVFVRFTAGGFVGARVASAPILDALAPYDIESGCKPGSSAVHQRPLAPGELEERQHIYNGRAARACRAPRVEPS
jgi:hypothetical protein